MARQPTGLQDALIDKGASVRTSGRGFATLGSGVAAVDIAIADIKSGDLLHVTAFPQSFGAIASNQGGLAVTSVNPGVGVTVGTMTGVAYPWDTKLHWIKTKTKA